MSVTTIKKEWVDFPQHSETFWVSDSVGDDTNSGRSPVEPKKTIQAAINAATDSASAVVHIDRGTYFENLNFNKSTIMLQGYAVGGNHLVEVRATGAAHTIAAGVTRVRCKDILFRRSDTGLVFNDFGSDGRHYFDNCVFVNTQGPSNTAIQRANGANWFEMIQCGIMGRIALGGAPAAGSSMTALRCDFIGGTVEMNHTNWIFSAIGSTRQGLITHNAGTCIIDDIVSFVPSPGGDSIVSTADDSSPTNFLSISRSNMYVLSAADYAKIDKTGNCPYVFDRVNRSVSADVLNGTKLNVGLPIADIRDLGSITDSLFPTEVSIEAANFTAEINKAYLCAGSIDVQLPAAVDKARILIKMVGAGPVTLVRDDVGDEIDAQAQDYVMSSLNESVTLLGFGGNWFII